MSGPASGAEARAGGASTAEPPAAAPAAASPSPASGSPAAPAAPAPSTWATTALFRKLAHDIVGTAGVARGAIDELARAEGTGPADSKMMFDLARRSLARLDRLARRLRLAALAQEGPLTRRSGPVDVSSVLDAAIADASTLDARKTVQLERMPAAGDFVVHGDAEHIHTAIAELVSNALRFARKRVRVAIERSDARVVVLVEDDGPGWPTGFEEALFPILRERPGQRGSGVSLPVVAVIAREHGGGLSLQPSSLADAQGRPGARARFELTVAV